MPSMPSRAATLGNWRANSAPISRRCWSSVLKCLRRRGSMARSSGGQVVDPDLAAFEIHLGAQQHLDRDGLRPQVAADFDLELIVVICGHLRCDCRDLQGGGDHPRLEFENGVADAALEGADV